MQTTLLYVVLPENSYFFYWMDFPSFILTKMYEIHSVN